MLTLSPGHWTPTDNSLIVAVTQEWPERPACGEFLEVALKGHGGKPGKSVTVRGTSAYLCQYRSLADPTRLRDQSSTCVAAAGLESRMPTSQRPPSRHFSTSTSA